MAGNALNTSCNPMALESYFGLVQAIAAKIKRRLPAHVDVEDLVQTGMIGLLEASNRFDESRMVNFSSYANSRITGAILDELRKWDTCSRQDRKIAREIENAKESFRANHGCEPERDEIAAAVGLGLQAYDRTLHRLESSKQPRRPAEDADSDPTDELERIPGKGPTPFECCCRHENSTLLRFCLAQLKPRHRRVLELYYFNEMGLKEIGAELSVGEARVSQIHKQAVGELKRMMKEYTGSTNLSALIQ